ncbi:MAG: radical SAM family heme chaperone HemW [Pirellulaceae bacterium]
MQPIESVYVHVPFCRHRCGYCNFALVADRDYLIDRYLNALSIELEQASPEPTALRTLYFGGGTPSHLSNRHLEQIVRMLSRYFSISNETEFTLEANPQDLLQDRADGLNKLGINRVSLGVQSFDDQKLKRLDRDHTADDIRYAIDECHRFANSISIDLIFDAPDESIEDWERELSRVPDLGIHHVSTYELTYEKGTRFWSQLSKGGMEQGSEDKRLEMYKLAIESLGRVGLEQYEISSFALNGHRSMHNQVYWSGKPYWAFGPGASGYVSAKRYQNAASVNRYIQLLESGERPWSDLEALPDEQRCRELFAIGLRQLDGINPIEFERITGRGLASVCPTTVQHLHEIGMLTFERNRIRLSEAGKFVYDSIATEILNGLRETERS